MLARRTCSRSRSFCIPAGWKRRLRPGLMIWPFRLFSLMSVWPPPLWSKAWSALKNAPLIQDLSPWQTWKQTANYRSSWWLPGTRARLTIMKGSVIAYRLVVWAFLPPWQTIDRPPWLAMTCVPSSLSWNKSKSASMVMMLAGQTLCRWPVRHRWRK